VSKIADVIAQAIADQKYFVMNPAVTNTFGAGALPCFYNPPTSGITYLVVDFIIQKAPGPTGSVNNQPVTVNGGNSLFAYRRSAVPPVLGAGSQTPLVNAFGVGAACPVTTLGNADAAYTTTPSVRWGINTNLEINTVTTLSQYTLAQASEPAYFYPGDMFGCLDTIFKTQGVFMGITLVQVAP
jgi:hypothetical protein